MLDGNGNGGGIELEQGTSSFYLNSTSDATVPPGFESPSLTIKNCTAIDGAALHAIDTALYVHDTSIVGNAAAERGGAVFLGTEAWMHLGSSSVSGNTAGDGGAVYASGAGQPAIEVYDSALEGNTANRNGGAVYAERYLEIVSSTLRGNVAHENGGAIALVSKDVDFEASLTLAHANVFGNEASGLSGQGNGGAIYLYGDNADMLIDDSDTNSRATDIYNNTAKGSGGGVYVEGAGESGTASTTMATGSVRDNAAAGGKAAVWPSRDSTFRSLWGRRIASSLPFSNRASMQTMRREAEAASTCLPQRTCRLKATTESSRPTRANRKEAASP